MFGSWLEVIGTLWFVALIVILGWVMWPGRRRRANTSAKNFSNQAPFDAGSGNVGSGNVHFGGGHGDGGGA